MSQDEEPRDKPNEDKTTEYDPLNEERKEEENEDKTIEYDPIKEEGNQNIEIEFSLLPAMEVEIIGPESFTRCGLGRLTGQWLQKLARPEIYLICFCLAALAQGIFFAYTSGILSTIERRFKLPSAASGFITTGNDVMAIFLSLHLAHVAGNGHRPRWLAGGLFMSTFGCFLTIIPHFIFGGGDYSDLTVKLIDGRNESSEMNKGWNYCGQEPKDDDSCSESSSSVGIEQYTVTSLQFLGQILSGLANICFYVVGYSYLDEAVDKEKVPLYFAISGCMRLFGPVCGMALSGFCLELWVDLDVEPSIDPSHPRWVGAWWLGYPIIMVVMVLASIPLMLMPRILPGARDRTLNKLRAAAKQGHSTFTAVKDSLRPLHRPPFRDILTGLRRLSRRKVFVAIVINQTFFWFLYFGYLTFQSKYIENQFKMPAAQANKATALAGMLASILGWLGMGSMLTFFKPNIKLIMYISLTLSILGMAACLWQATITCSRDQLIGLENVFSKINSNYSLKDDYPLSDEVSSCIDNCSCNVQYSPVCINKTLMFFSSCHAGCTNQYTYKDTMMFDGCTCADIFVFGPDTIPSKIGDLEKGNKEELEIRNGPCFTGCDNFIYYSVFTVSSQMLVAANRVIANIIFFRSVNERDKDLALAVINLLIAAGLILNPITIGALIDYSCVLWQRTCGRRGYCYLYDLDSYSWVLHGVPAIGMLWTFLTECYVLKRHEDIDFFGDKEIEELKLFHLLGRRKTKGKTKSTSQEKDVEC